MATNAVTRVIIESMPAGTPGWVAVLSALLTPLIAILAVYVAYQQYRTNHLRLQYETYERRFKVYKIVQGFLSDITRNAKDAFPRIHQFYEDASEATFLFAPEVQGFIDTLYEKAVDLERVDQERSAGSQGLREEAEGRNIVQERAKLMNWFCDQLSQSKELFRKHMGMKR